MEISVVKSKCNHVIGEGLIWDEVSHQKPHSHFPATSMHTDNDWNQPSFHSNWFCIATKTREANCILVPSGVTVITKRPSMLLHSRPYCVVQSFSVVWCGRLRWHYFPTLFSKERLCSIKIHFCLCVAFVAFKKGFWVPYFVSGDWLTI